MVEQLFTETLRKHGFHVTLERTRLFHELKDQNDPCSIEDLVNLTQDELNRSTVYRNLDLFEKIGITSRVYAGWKYKVELSDTFSPHHHHMTCTNCKKVISFHEPDSFKQELHKLETDHRFKAKSHSLELTGLCRDCC